MKQDIIVNGILQDNGKVLLAKRALTKKIAPGKYHLPGGHVEFGEDPKEALKRELLEEFGINSVVKDVVSVFSYVNGDVHTVGISFEAISNDDMSNIIVDETDNESVVWVDAKHLKRYLSEDDHDYQNLTRHFGVK